ncbi:MAG TPA: hypothetical protein EYP21_05725 [Syntrophaceae bacterium]|nr:hypothetical protein [Syntrophaceae bacterium]
MATGEIQVVPVSTRKQESLFIKFPWKVYRGDPYWVPPLISERKRFLNPKINPFFHHAQVKLFLAHKDKEILGRIAAVVDDQYINYYHQKVGFFGLFECLPDYSVAYTLLQSVEKWLKEMGMETIQGPMNLSTNHECGLLIEGFDSPPVFMTPYNPSYYRNYLENYGFQKVKDLYAYFIDFSRYEKGKLEEKIERVLSRRNLRVRPVNLKNFENEAQTVREIYNSAWGNNWGFVPMTDEEFWYMGKELKKIVIPDLALIAELDGKAVGFTLTVPDINQVLKRLNGRLFPWGIFKWFYYYKKIDVFRALILGIIEKYRHLGLDLLLYVKLAEAAKKNGYLKWEISWILEDNTAVHNVLRKRLNAQLYKKYRIFEKAI